MKKRDGNKKNKNNSDNQLIKYYKRKKQLYANTSLIKIIF